MKDLKPPTWWPPKVGTKLRHATHHGAGASHIKRVDALLHVLSVFTDKDGEEQIVTAEWFPTKGQWHYAVWDWYATIYGRIWPDGTKKPENPYETKSP